MVILLIRVPGRKYVSQFLAMTKVGGRGLGDPGDFCERSQVVPCFAVLCKKKIPSPHPAT